MKTTTCRSAIACVTAVLLAIFAFGSPAAHAQNTDGADAPGVLLYTTLDDANAVAQPVIGLGGTTTVLPGGFVPGYEGSGAQFVGGSLVIFPTAAGNTSNIDLDRGEVSFWYRPRYDAGADDVIHALIVVGDIYNPPHLVLEDSDRLRLSLMTADWTYYWAESAWRAPLWTADQWVHIRGVWDTNQPADSLQLYVNGLRVDEGSGAGGWALGSTAALGSIFVGAGNADGHFSADGVIDELRIGDIGATPAPPPGDDSVVNPAPTPEPAPDPGLDPGPEPNPEPGPVSLTPAALPVQPAGTPFIDPVFGTTLRRVSDTSDRGGFETHIYSQLQAFSSDNAYLLLAGSNGYLVRRTGDLSQVAGLVTWTWNAPRWHPTQPHTLIHFDSNEDTVVRVQFTDVDTLTTTTVFTFPGQYERVLSNQSFDEIARNGRWMAGMVSRNDGAQVIFALDLQNRTLGAQLALSALYAGPCQPDPVWGEIAPDWVGVSPLGNYLVVQWPRDGTSRCSGMETFDLSAGHFIGRVYEGHAHGDLGVDVDGVTEFFMTFELSSPMDNNRPAIGMRLLPGTATFSPPIYLRVMDWGNTDHISCRGPYGVCLVTAGTWEDNVWTPFEGEIFLQYTDGSVQRLVHHRSSRCGYWVQPRASLARDGRYVVFASDWGQETGTDSCGDGSDLGRGDPYIIDLGP